ncbi:DNA-binding transcriptional regulator, XRE-family HTH domain [Atopostipes suicloacalis DSM 15692]|uniref:DNA-binding transcriptional regulator, XRE-family HTH domain n=1 Tax=Atopostipes suicloacalis DSM 15692 TaxID=1121025 RepID=A0A1M4SLG3_9LACT|nr:helix-turn-helix transcriptional regulator [Atopostipes suicloacalis]SHE33046.1 DNA-binding transcriptional regulator, XRE-family HTH domain [Atopostipes suicloacalis DSM 15692]
MGFSNRLETLRKSINLSQEELAKILNIDRTSIVHYENSKSGRIPRPDTLEEIANFFGVSIDYLLDRTDNKEVTIEEEGFISDTDDLSLAELQKKYQITVDGEPASDEELEGAIDFIRSLREKNSFPQ